MKKLLLGLLFALPAFGQNVPYSDITLSSRGTPVGGAPIAVCNNPGLSTTAAQVISNIAVLTMSSNPITAGFVANQAIAVSGFTGADTYFNGGTVTSTGITNNFLILSVTSTQITYSLIHANASATTSGSAFQAGSQAQACAPLSSIFVDPAGATPIAQPGLTSTGLGNYQFYAAPNSYYVQFFGATIGELLKPIVLPPSTVNGTTSFSNLTVSGTGTTIATLNGICLIDGVTTNRTTIAAALGDATCNIIDDRGFKSGGNITPAQTISRQVQLLLACPATYNGPASGSTFTFTTGSAGSSIVGCGQTDPANMSGETVITKILGNASNTSDMIAVLGKSANGIQGLRFEHFTINGNNSAINCFTADTMQRAFLNDVRADNCTSLSWNMTTTNTVLNSGTQFNILNHLGGTGSPTLFKCSGNVGVADFTANTIVDLQGSYGVGASTAPGIWLNACDGNVFEGVTKPFRKSGTGCDMEIDTNAFSNQFYDFYGNTGCNVTAASLANTGDFNFIFGYDITNGESAPQGAGANQLAWQPNGVVGGAGGSSGLIYPNNTCFTSWDNGTGLNCMIKMDGSNNVDMNSADTGIYQMFASGSALTSQIRMGSWAFSEGTAPLVQSTFSGCGSSSTFHEIDCSLNGGTIQRMPLIAQGDSVYGTYRVTADQTITAGASLTNIPGLSWTMPASVALNVAFHCEGSYNETTAATSMQFGIQDVTIAPTNIYTKKVAWTSISAASSDNTPTLTTTTATGIGAAFTPSAATTVFNFTLDGMIEQPSNASASVVNIMAQFTTNNGVIKRGSYCRVW